MALVTTDELKGYLQSICKEETEILDVFYYESTGNNGVTVSSIVVIYVTHYTALSNSIHTASFNTVEKSIAYFEDTSKYTIVSSKLTTNMTATLISN